MSVHSRPQDEDGGEGGGTAENGSGATFLGGAGAGGRDDDGPAAQPQTHVPGDSTNPIEIVDSFAEVISTEVDDRGLPESMAGELPSRLMTSAVPGPGAAPPGAPPVVHAPPPLPLPASMPIPVRVRARTRSSERVAMPPAVPGGPLTRDQVMERVRRGEPLRGASLRGLDLSGARLGHADLARADLEQADLRGAHLEKVVLRGASLRGARLDGTDLRGANLESADLSEAEVSRAVMIKANLTLARLEGTNLAGANLAEANLSLAQLRGTRLTGANLNDAVFAHAHLVRADLTGAKAVGADFTDADLRGAILAEGDLTGAAFAEARLAGADARKARMGGISFADADLRRADLSRADLSHADLRRANFSEANLAGASLTGAKVDRLSPTGTRAEGLSVVWVDASPTADGSQRVEGGQALVLICGAAAAAQGERRYFGRGDVVQNASLAFGDNARVEIDSRLEGCSITLGDRAELVVGKAGALYDCRITGGARLVVHGRVFERDADDPAITGTRALMVGATGRVVASIEQADGGTRFGFERGCRLRLTIGKLAGGAPEDPAAAAPPEGAFTTPIDGTVTVVGRPGRLVGNLTTEGAILVRGEVEGNLEGSRIEVAETGVVDGRLKAAELRARGIVSGELEADSIELGGQVRDGSLVRTEVLVIPWDEATGAPRVRFGQVTLEVGTAPSRDEPIEPTPPPVLTPTEEQPTSPGESASALTGEARSEARSEAKSAAAQPAAAQAAADDDEDHDHAVSATDAVVAELKPVLGEGFPEEPSSPGAVPTEPKPED